MAKTKAPDILTVEEAAAYLRIKRSTVYKWVHEGKIPHHKVGGSIRFSRRLLLEWIENNA
jgi:excisionase family DNA binding protein